MLTITGIPQSIDCCSISLVDTCVGAVLRVTVSGSNFRITDTRWKLSHPLMCDGRDQKEPIKSGQVILFSFFIDHNFVVDRQLLYYTGISSWRT